MHSERKKQRGGSARWVFWGAIITVTLVFAGILAVAKMSQGSGKAVKHRVVDVRRRDVQKTLRLSGRVRPLKVADVKSPVSGRLVAFLVKQGEVVQKGQSIAVLEPDQSQSLLLEQARIEVRVRQIALQQADRDYVRSRELEKSGIAAHGDFERARDTYDTARESLALASAQLDILERQAPRGGHGAPGGFHLVAPVAGTVLAEQVAPGETIISGTSGLSAGGTVVMRIADVSSFVIHVDVGEIDALKVRPGLRTEISAAAEPGVKIRGHVASMAVEGTTAQSLTTYRAEIALDEPTHLLPEMSCDVDIVVAERPNVLAIPSSAVIRRGHETLVRKINSTAPTPIVTGLAGDEYIEITSGVSEGDRLEAQPVTIPSTGSRD